MKKLTKALAALMLTVALVCAAGCNKTDGPNNGGNSNEVEINYVDGSYADLGLPSGTLWGTCNLGGVSPEDLGHYFAWGETRPNDDDYDWNHYKYGNGSSFTDPQLTKYCNMERLGYNGYTDTLTTLLPEDDAATAYGDSTWCMPTEAQWEELRQNATATWTTLNGVNGMAFTRNGKSIFIPAGGRRWGDYLERKGKVGYYWSSTLHNWPYDALYFWVSVEGSNTANIERPYGFSIRPVRSPKFNP